MESNYKIIKVKALAKPGEVEAAISAFTDFVIKDYNITAETDVVCYKERRPYISPSDESYGMRWEINSQELLALILGYRAASIKPQEKGEYNMNKTTIFKLKQHITKDDLADAGFLITDSGAIRGTVYGDFIYIPLQESSRYGYRVIQYGEVNTIPEDLNLDDIEDLVTRGWVEEANE